MVFVSCLIVVRDALYEPVRTCQLATHFKPFVEPATGESKYMPCSPSDPQGKEMTLMDVPNGKLKPMDLSMADFSKVLHNAKARFGLFFLFLLRLSLLQSP